MQSAGFARRVTVSIALIVASVAVAVPERHLSAVELTEQQWQSRVQPTVDLLRTQGRQDPGFVSIGVDASTRRITVYVSRNADRDSYLGLPIPAGMVVEVKRALLDQAQSDQTVRAIVAGKPRLRHEGVNVIEVTNDLHGAISVVVEKPLTPDGREAVEALAPFGAKTVAVKEGTATTPTGRLDDTSPWYGGDLVNSANGTHRDGSVGPVYCTTGFTGVSRTNGQRYLVTAYHCIQPNDKRIWTHGVFLGTVSAIDFAADLAFIPISQTAPYVWTGTTASGAAKQVTSVVHPATGDQICTLGVTSESLCYSTVASYSHYMIQPDWAGVAPYDVVLWNATRNGGGVAVSAGDSGGTIVKPTGSTVAAYGGTTSGGGTKFPKSSCPQMADCYPTVRFSDTYTVVYQKYSLTLT